MHLAVFSPQTVEALKQIVPHTASVANPVDLTFNRNPNDYTETIPGVLLADDSVDSMFLYTLLPWRRVMQTIMATGKTAEEARVMADSFVAGQADAVIRTWTERGKPMVGGSFCTRDEAFIRELQDRGLPVLPSPERAMSALAALTQYARYRAAAEQ